MGTAEREKELLAGVAEDMRAEADNRFRNAVRAKLGEITAVQKQLVEMTARLGKLKGELKEIHLEQVDLSAIEV